MVVRIYRNILREIPPDFGERDQMKFVMCCFRKVEKGGSLRQATDPITMLNLAFSHCMTHQTSTHGEDTRSVPVNTMRY